MYSTDYSSPIGEMLIASDGEAVCGVWFYGQKHFPPTEDFIIKDELAVFKTVEQWFDDYFKGLNPEIDFKLKPEGTEFKLKVWKIISEIRYGETLTYGEIASRISPMMSARAVGSAVGRNPISVLIPCHRVIGADGRLTGYAGGVERKINLLKLEGAR